MGEWFAQRFVWTEDPAWSTPIVAPAPHVALLELADRAPMHPLPSVVRDQVLRLEHEHMPGLSLDCARAAGIGDLVRAYKRIARDVA